MCALSTPFLSMEMLSTPNLAHKVYLCVSLLCTQSPFVDVVENVGRWHDT
jgi:hypothetical protein